MTTLKLASTVVTLAITLSFPAAVTAGAKNTTTTEDPTDSRGIGFGIATADSVVGGAAGSTALSSLHLLDTKNTIQTYFGVSSTSPFQFGMGGLYKHTIAGNQENGLHAGGGLGL